ncbi:hypothetical protein, partial [Streptococcus agalactiae]|uniref:hypothetical protein n=1 Tax=Streptococcus agalactiae TaxID=1311 RepID=UPI0029C18166
PYCIKSTAFNLAAWNPMHSIMLHKIHAFKRVPILHTAWNPLHSITLPGIQCIQWDPLYIAAWNTLHSIMLHAIHVIALGSIAARCMELTAFSHAA